MGDAAFTALTTERLVLRRFRPEDLDAFVAYRSDPETARYQSWEAPYRPRQARQFLQELQAIHPDTPGEWFQFAVALRHTDRLIGDCGAHVCAEDARQAEIGFTLAPAPGLRLRHRGGPPAAALPAHPARQASGQGNLRRSQRALGCSTAGGATPSC
jgi:RimJ/RimL family protein N-acetyltransferase